MPSIHANPAEMRRFANALDGLCESLREKKHATSRMHELLAEVWRDKKYYEFEKTFSVASKDMDQFLKACGVYSGFLRKKAARLDDYLGN